MPCYVCSKNSTLEARAALKLCCHILSGVMSADERLQAALAGLVGAVAQDMSEWLLKAWARPPGPSQWQAVRYALDQCLDG